MKTLRHLFASLAIIAAASSAIACSPQPTRSQKPLPERVKRTYNISHIEGIEADGLVTVNFTQGPLKAVTVEGRREVLAKSRVWEDDYNLKITNDYCSKATLKSIKDAVKGEDNSIVVTVQSPELKEIEMDDMATFKAADLKAVRLKAHADDMGNIEIGTLGVDHLRAEVSDMGKLQIDTLNAEELTLTASDMGEATIDAGSADVVTLKASDMGKINARGLKALKGKITATDMGELKCNVAKVTKTEGDMGKISNQAE